MKVSFKKMQLVEKKYAVFTLIGRNLELLRRGEKTTGLHIFTRCVSTIGEKISTHFYANSDFIS